MRVAFLCFLLLSGCAITHPREEVKIPVREKCLGEDPAQPEYRFGLGAYPGDKEAVKLMGQDLNVAKQYALDLKVQMSGCRQ